MIHLDEQSLCFHDFLYFYVIGKGAKESSQIFYESFQIQYKHRMCTQYNLPELKK